MPSGTPPEEPEDAAPQPDDSPTGEVPVHPDDRLWRHPSELARMRAAQRSAAAAQRSADEEPPPTPLRTRQGATSAWASRIPTSLVIAAGIAAVMASVGGVVALAHSGPTGADGTPTSSFRNQDEAIETASVVAGSMLATGVIVDPAGVVVVSMIDPPEEATLIAGDRRAPATLRSSDPGLSLAAYQVASEDQQADPADGDEPTATAWPMPTGSSDLGHMDLQWFDSGWGPMLAADLSDADLSDADLGGAGPGDAELAPGTAMAENGQLVGLTTLTNDGRMIAVPWPVLRSLGTRLGPEPPTMGKLPATLSDDGTRLMVTEAWGDGSLQPKDRLLAVDGHPVASADEAQAVAGFHPQEATAKVSCERSGKSVTVSVILD